jgi:hypothetical protein
MTENTDRRVMTTNAATAEALAKDVTERIGDGSQMQPEHFDALNYAERMQLHKVNPERYRALRDGTLTAWTPEAGK